MKKAYITSTGVFLPGNPISNNEMEAVLGQVGSSPSRSRKRILKQNGIQTRHYAINNRQETQFSNSRMAANSIEDAVGRSDISLDDLQLLVASTTQADLPVPGFASMVHGELKMPATEIASIQGICASSMIGFRHAASLIRNGDVSNAVCTASEFPSRLAQGVAI